jgi:ATP-dependent DNA ligase
MMRKKPMLAYPVSDKPIDYTQPVFMQPKLDGVRCLIQQEFHKDGDKVVAYSRTGKKWLNIDHVLQSLKPFFQGNPDVILDGELYNHALRDDFEKIISCVRKTKPTDADRAESRRLVQFHCYDIVDETMPFDERYKFVFDNLRDSYGVRTVETTQCFTEGDAKVFHEDNLDRGYEGSILRLNTEYHCKRSHSLRKFKDFHDAEAVITDWVEGKGKRKGTIGKFMAIDADGNEFGMPVMDNFKKLQTMFKEMQSWVGKEATFTYFERTKANSYRHPLFKAIRDYE